MAKQESIYGLSVEHRSRIATARRGIICDDNMIDYDAVIIGG